MIFFLLELLTVVLFLVVSSEMSLPHNLNQTSPAVRCVCSFCPFWVPMADSILCETQGAAMALPSLSAGFSLTTVAASADECIY